MSGSSAPIDRVGCELYDLADQYAARAEALADDPYFREAVIKVAVSSFSWAMHRNFQGVSDRWALDLELRNQAEAVGRSILASEGSPTGDRWLAIQTIDHVQIAMPAGGEVKARSFYGALLGLPEKPKPSELAARGGCWFEDDRIKLHLGVETPFTAARKAHIAFRVGDVAGLAARARAAGYEVVDDKALPGHERVFIFDPFGNRLEFLRPLEAGE